MSETTTTSAVESRPGHRRLGTLLAGLLVVMLGSLSVPLTVANAEDSAAVRAAQQIQAARDRANAAAQAMFEAQSRLDTLDVEVAETERELVSLEAQADSMRSSLQHDAQRSFVNSGKSMPLLIDLDQANAAITADRQAAVARGVAAVELDDFDAVMKDVTQKRGDLEAQRKSTTAAREQFEQRQRDAEAEVDKLAEIERQRLADVAVQQELERQRQARLAQERAEAERAAAERAAEIAATTTAAPARVEAASVEPAGAAAAPSPAASASPDPAPAPAPPGGTPLVAVESGTAQFRTTNLGGNSVSLHGASGTRYFYAHLSSWEGSSRSVSQGEVIGYVGRTGNTSANHLHFEVHPGGGRAVNPYPYVRAVC